MGRCIFAWIYKVALKEKTRLLRRLNNIVNPIFDTWLDQVATGEEKKQAKAYARSAAACKVGSDQTEAWMKGQKAGFGNNILNMDQPVMLSTPVFCYKGEHIYQITSSDAN